MPLLDELVAGKIFEEFLGCVEGDLDAARQIIVDLDAGEHRADEVLGLAALKQQVLNQGVLRAAFGGVLACGLFG